MTDLLWHSILALCAGILLNAAPCVLPVIPLKVRAVMTDFGDAWVQRLTAALAMLAGSLGFFLILGGATVFLGLTWGALFKSKIFIALLAVFLLLAGLVTLVGWSFPLPQWVHQIKGRRYAGAVMTGLLSGLLATPCGGPFLGAVLAYGLTQPPMVGLVIFLSIGTGLVLPYMLLVTWPWLGHRVFSGGAWTVQVKQLLGFVLMAGAVFFAQSLTGPIIGRILWVFLPVAIMAWALASLIQFRHWGQRLLPAITAAVIIGMAAVRLIAAPPPSLNWRPYTPQAMVEARANHHPLILEFTAEWCLNCKVLEKTTYADRRVIDAAQKAGIVALRVDMTDMQEKAQQLMLKFGGRALPYVVLFDGRGRIHQTYTGLVGAPTLAEALTKIKTKG